VPDIRIRRDHDLGLPRAREVAWLWAEQAEQQLGMECAVVEGDTSDTVEFQRSGCQGRLIVAADHFDLDAKLGFLLGAFSATIESEIRKNLDALLAQGGRTVAGGARSTPKGAAKGASKAAVPKGAAKVAAKAAVKAKPAPRRKA
jgi:putative polyhydroxyalkanoate system protein